MTSSPWMVVIGAEEVVVVAVVVVVGSVDGDVVGVGVVVVVASPSPDPQATTDRIRTQTTGAKSRRGRIRQSTTGACQGSVARRGVDDRLIGRGRWPPLSVEVEYLDELLHHPVGMPAGPFEEAGHVRLP